MMKKKVTPKVARKFDVKKEAWANYRNDIKAGHKDAIEYWGMVLLLPMTQ